MTYFVINACVYGASALYYCFIQIYLLKSHDTVTVGTLLSIGPIVAVVAPVFWGIWADKAKYKNIVLAVAMMGSGIAYCTVALTDNVVLLGVILAVNMWFLSSFGGLVDTITIEYTYDNGLKYGVIRIFGTIAFGLIACVLSFYLEQDLNLIFKLYAVVCLVSFVMLLISPKVRGHSYGKKSDGKSGFDIRPVFKDRTLMWMIGFTGIAQFAWGYYLNFFPSHLEDLGMPSSVWGLNVFITVLGEIPFFLYFNKLFTKFGPKKILFAGLALTVVRYFALAAVTGDFAVLAVGLVTGVSVSTFTYCCAVHINENMPAGITATAQTVVYALGVGLPKVLAGIGGGYMTRYFGTGMSLVFCGILSAAAFALYPVAFKKKA